jgi:hypothetical protein
MQKLVVYDKSEASLVVEVQEKPIMKASEEVSQLHDPLPKKPERQNFMKKLNDLIDELKNNHDLK